MTKRQVVKDSISHWERMNEGDSFTWAIWIEHAEIMLKILKGFLPKATKEEG